MKESLEQQKARLEAELSSVNAALETLSASRIGKLYELFDCNKYGLTDAHAVYANRERLAELFEQWRKEDYPEPASAAPVQETKPRAIFTVVEVFQGGELLGWELSSGGYNMKVYANGGPGFFNGCFEGGSRPYVVGNLVEFGAVKTSNGSEQ